MGIDYGMGQTNIDQETGIRYGVISQNSVLQAWADSSEADYGEPTCPKCGNEVVSRDDTTPDECDNYIAYSYGPIDYICHRCEIGMNSESAYGDEPHGYKFEGDGFSAVTCLDTDIMIVKSPFFTLADFCSPCVPGAGNLDSTPGHRDVGDGSVDAYTQHHGWDCQAYCFGHDWFDTGMAPYPVFGVISGLPCFPDGWYGHAMPCGVIYSAPPASALKTDYCA